MLYEELTDQIIRCYYYVYRTLGYGFLEKVYENALIIKLKSEGFTCIQQPLIEVYFEGEVVGTYQGDILVNGKILLELKAGNTEHLPAHEYQLINYLKATGTEVGLLLFFGQKPYIKRKIYSNNI